MYRLRGKFLPRMMDKFLYDRLIPFQDAFRFESMPNKLTGSTEKVFEFTEKMKDKIETAAGRKTDARVIEMGNKLTSNDLRKIAQKGSVLKRLDTRGNVDNLNSLAVGVKVVEMRLTFGYWNRIQFLKRCYSYLFRPGTIFHNQLTKREQRVFTDMFAKGQEKIALHDLIRLYDNCWVLIEEKHVGLNSSGEKSLFSPNEGMKVKLVNLSAVVDKYIVPEMDTVQNNPVWANVKKGDPFYVFYEFPRALIQIFVCSVFWIILFSGIRNEVNYAEDFEKDLQSQLAVELSEYDTPWWNQDESNEAALTEGRLLQARTIARRKAIESLALRFALFQKNDADLGLMSQDIKYVDDEYLFTAGKKILDINSQYFGASVRNVKLTSHKFIHYPDKVILKFGRTTTSVNPDDPNTCKAESEASLICFDLHQSLLEEGVSSEIVTKITYHKNGRYIFDPSVSVETMNLPEDHLLLHNPFLHWFVPYCSWLNKKFRSFQVRYKMLL